MNSLGLVRKEGGKNLQVDDNEERRETCELGSLPLENLTTDYFDDDDVSSAIWEALFDYGAWD